MSQRVRRCRVTATPLAGGTRKMDNVRSIAGVRAPDVRDLRANVAGQVVVPGDESWDEARQAWNLATDQRPVAVAIPENVQDVVEIVNYACESGLQVAPQGTGH